MSMEPTAASPSSARVNYLEVSGGVKLLRSQYLAGIREECRNLYPTIPSTSEKSEFTINGTLADVAQAHPELEQALYNEVKVCEKCKKPNGFTCMTCNGCKSSLISTQVSKSENLFSAFLLGVRNASKGFPLTISIRRQTEDVLIIDDPLAVSPCHFCAIPRKCFIPDWRYLLNSPKKALELLDVLEAECWAAQQQFLSNAEYRSTFLRGRASDAHIRTGSAVGFSFPPAQFQLHLQWQVPPFLAAQHHSAERGDHWQEGRFFPLEYVRKVLQLDKPCKVVHNTEVEELIEYFKTFGVDYHSIWKEFHDRCLQCSRDLQNWDAEHFRYVVQAEKVHEFEIVNGVVKVGKEVNGVKVSELNTKDKVALQNYGRPYTSEGRPGGSYIKHPVKPQFGPGGFGEWHGVEIMRGASH